MRADVEVRLTERPGHATDLARAPGADVVVAMGGDGTANEVANGIPAEALMGVVPAGASSVFARQLRLPRQTLPAAAVLAGAIAERRWRPVGLGSVNGRMFTFSAGIGLEAEATRIVDERRRAARRTAAGPATARWWPRPGGCCGATACRCPSAVTHR